MELFHFVVRRQENIFTTKTRNGLWLVASARHASRQKEKKLATLDDVEQDQIKYD